MSESLPILYSFRRCPYAMRARFAIYASGLEHEHREILLRDKPAEMLAVSPKGTVPVLVLPDGQVIDESAEIVFWALEQADPKSWLDIDRERCNELIAQCDGEFKSALDRYKYHVRFPEQSAEDYFQQALPALQAWNLQLEEHDGLGLLASRLSVADYAIAPFVRQFANVNLKAFNDLTFVALQRWLGGILGSDEFTRVMQKHPLWKDS